MQEEIRATSVGLVSQIFYVAWGKRQALVNLFRTLMLNAGDISASLVQPQVYLGIRNISENTCSKSDLGTECIVCAPLQQAPPVTTTVMFLLETLRLLRRLVLPQVKLCNVGTNVGNMVGMRKDWTACRFLILV
jgi:hypothetical protein